MKVCKKCGKTFSSTIRIDGKKKNLQNREYCLDCSPFGQHNTKKLDKKKKPKLCSLCGKEHNGYKKYCGYCYVKIRRYRIKVSAIKYKGGKCECCGYNECEAALTFHHVDASEKDFSIADMKNKSWDAIKSELDKCILICANCHSKIHSDYSNEALQKAVEEYNGELYS